MQAPNYNYDYSSLGQSWKPELKPRPLPWHLESPGWFAVIVGSSATFALWTLMVGLPNILK